MPSMNGNPIGGELAARQLRTYHDLVGRSRTQSEDNIQAGQIVRAGLYGGVLPDEIRAALLSLNVDAERAEKLLSRAIEQTGYVA
ncbi:MAG TPA: hypothetical protein VM529_05820 [Gemmata sp.]|jgi:hypothetical protein|nr:hypothetical protein [Gemmata sp.]